MNNILRAAFFQIIVRPALIIALGFNVRRRELLPKNGPAVIVANHNSHLDTLTLMALFPISQLPKLRPVAAADYFLSNRLLAWFATKIIGIIPLARGGVSKHPLAELEAALDRGEILILFPEGSRGEPEQMTDFKRGVAYLAKARSDTPMHPVFLHGLGKALPKGSWFFVPFNCDVFVGESFTWNGDAKSFMEDLSGRMNALADEGKFPPWE